MINLSTVRNFNYAKKYPQGAVIASGNTQPALFILLDGQVGVFQNDSRQNQQLTGTIGPGDFFGETELFLDKKPQTSAVALTDVIALVINREDMAAFFRDEAQMALEFIKALCIRLDSMDAAYKKLSGRSWSEQKPSLKKAAFVQALNTQNSAATAPAPQTAHVQQSAPVPPAQTPASVQTPAKKTDPNIRFSLFPQGHGSYQLPIDNTDHHHLLEKTMSCPMCKKDFTAFKVRNTNLVPESTDSDMRNRYKGFEPLYYDVITCPNCLYSALAEMFGHPDRPKAQLPQELKAIKDDSSLQFGPAMDTSSMFAGYYLALLCAPICFTKHPLATAKLLLKLSRIYQDCGDKQMEDKTEKQALEAYMNVYQSVQIPPSQEQQLNIIIGELFLKQNDLKNAKNHFFNAKKDRSGVPRLQRHAENRLFDIREMEEKT